MTSISDHSADLVAGRSCDGCTMCCKLMSIAELDKPRGVWCKHCDKKRGCSIYEERPGVCRGFYCGYRRIKDLDERWKPSQSKIIINYESTHDRIALHIDPDRPDAWKEEPFYSAIKDWAKNAEAGGGTVVVWAGKNVTVVSSKHDRFLGPIRDDQFILPIHPSPSSGLSRDYIVVEADDPRLKG